MKSHHEDGWKLYVGDILIGTACYRESDQPWYICDFEPTPEFEKYRPIFDAYATLVNNPHEAPTLIDPAEYYEINIESLNLRLVPFGDVWRGDIFVAQIYGGSEAWLRPL